MLTNRMRWSRNHLVYIIHFYNNQRSLSAGILTILTNRLGDTFLDGYNGLDILRQPSICGRLSLPNTSAGDAFLVE